MAQPPDPAYERILLVKEPWVSLLVDGVKTWEMRTSGTNVRGRVGLAASGTGTVIGAATLVASHGPLHPDEFVEHRDKHQADPNRLTEYAAGGSLFAWEFTDAERFEPPVPYMHPSGAVIWVKVRK